MHACVLAAITASAAAAAAVACPPGFYATPATSCTPCAKNTYRSGLDPQSACLPCATGSTSPEAASACTQCPAGYTIDNTGTCKPCSPNTFNPTPGAAVNTTCQPCPDGLFALFGASACAACPPGRYVPMSKADAPSPEYVGDCIDCAANTYSDEPDSRTCMACPAGTTSKPGSKACDPCPAGSYLMQEDSWDPVTCEPCPAGSYSMQPMSQTCRRCPFGSTSAKGSTSCELCPAGSFVDSSHDSYSYGNCTVCPRNTYNDKPGYSGAGCKLCPAGFTAEEEGATECELCPAGSYVDVVPITADDVAHCYQCPPNTFSTQPGTVGGCSPCPNGTWSLEGSTECTRCPPGTYGSGSCTKCPPATYQDEAGAKECKPCPPGFTTLPGAKNLTQCKICPTGSYVKEESGECVPCPKDTYSDTLGTVGSCKACPPRTGAPEGSGALRQCRLCFGGRYFVAGHDGEPTGQCMPCPANTFSSAEGQDMCEPCPVGTTSEEGASKCTPCPAGSYVREGVVLGGDPYKFYEARCIACPVGFYSADPKSLECTPCPLGSTTDGSGATACTPCSDDTSGSEILGVHTCELCDPLSAAGAYTCPAGSGRRTGCTVADECEACPAGTVGAPSRDFRRDACVPCAIGSIAAAPGLTACAPCAAGSSTDRIGGSECTACKPGYFAAQAGDPCKACPPGTFASANGSTSCTPCAPGTTHFGRARTSQNECTVAHVAGTTITATETFVDRYGSYGAYRYDGLPSITSKTLVSTAPVRTITLVTGGDPVAAPPGYTECVTFFANGLVNTSAPETSKYDPPHPTFAVRYSVFEWTKGNVVGGPGTDDFALVVEYSDGGFQICGASRGADGTLKLSCEYDIKAGESLNIKFRQAETLTLTSVAGA